MLCSHLSTEINKPTPQWPTQAMEMSSQNRPPTSAIWSKMPKNTAPHCTPPKQTQSQQQQPKTLPSRCFECFPTSLVIHFGASVFARPTPAFGLMGMMLDSKATTPNTPIASHKLAPCNGMGCIGLPLLWLCTFLVLVNTRLMTIKLLAMSMPQNATLIAVNTSHAKPSLENTCRESVYAKMTGDAVIAQYL